MHIARYLIVAAPIALTACDATTTRAGVGSQPEAPTDQPLLASEKPRSAVATLRPTRGNDVRGSLRFYEDDGSLRIEGRLEGLQPGAHGFHIHEKGDCSAPDAESAGGHFSVGEVPHGSPGDPAEQHHLGDLGNVIASEDGSVEINIEDSELGLTGESSVIGKAVVLHSNRDDLESQPSGDAGSRIGCGEIRAAVDVALKR